MQLVQQEVVAGDIYCVVCCAGDVQGKLHICEIVIPDVIKGPFHDTRCMTHQWNQPQPASSIAFVSVGQG